jgi:transcription elongation factor GreA
MSTRPQPDPIPFTQTAFAALQQEKDRLTTERKEVLIRLQAAREMGDLSENGAYTYAKLELGSINRQLRRLTHLLTYGVVTQAASSTQVGFGNTVTLKTGQGKQVVYTIVSIHESDLAAGKLSTESPLGAALMGKSVGSQITVKAPAGDVVYQILEIN